MGPCVAVAVVVLVETSGSWIGPVLDALAPVLDAPQDERRAPPVRIIRGSEEQGWLQGIARVVDGDTIRVGGKKVRLADMDAPEIGQPMGPAARSHLARLCEGRQVRVRVEGTGYYGRLIGTVHVGAGSANPVNVNRQMVRDGYAYVNPRYSRRYMDEEHAARRARRGVHDGASREKPWDYRKRTKG